MPRIALPGLLIALLVVAAAGVASIAVDDDPKVSQGTRFSSDLRAGPVIVAPALPTPAREPRARRRTTTAPASRRAARRAERPTATAPAPRRTAPPRPRAPRPVATPAPPAARAPEQTSQPAAKPTPAPTAVLPPGKGGVPPGKGGLPPGQGDIPPGQAGFPKALGPAPGAGWVGLSSGSLLP